MTRSDLRFSPPAPPRRRRPSRLVAALLCVPGLLCGCVVAAAFSLLPGAAVALLGGWGVLAVVASACLGAVAVLFYYGDKRKPWYVTVCLLINAAGLAAIGYAVKGMLGGFR